MDVLHRMFLKARNDGVIRGLQLQEIKYQCSIYADDVMLFIRPTVQEATAVKEILTIFGEVSGLKTNMAKCSVTPIFDGKDSLQDIVAILGCQLQPFPIKYLGLPLSVKKIPKSQVQAIIEAVTRKLPPCHGSLMARSGHLVWIKSVLKAVPKLPSWVIKEIDAICRKFFWVGSDASVHGKCMVAWPAVCKPT